MQIFFTEEFSFLFGRNSSPTAHECCSTSTGDRRLDGRWRWALGLRAPCEV
jgi:hypothetical protein